jgi:hypothetical protein
MTIRLNEEDSMAYLFGGWDALAVEEYVLQDLALYGFRLAAIHNAAMLFCVLPVNRGETECARALMKWTRPCADRR